jgi:hypothetical protein
MRLPFRRRDDGVDSAALAAARKSREKAERDLAATQAETPKYKALARALREVRESNHLGQALTRSFRE